MLLRIRNRRKIIGQRLWMCVSVGLQKMFNFVILSPKECLRLILKRMFNRNPHVVLRSIILMDACVQNIGESFAKEISSRYFVTEIKSKSKGMHQKALECLCSMISKWSKAFSGSKFDFINELNKWLQQTYPICYAAGDDELNSRNMSKPIKNTVVGQEEADIAKAIALSLKETESKKSTLYPSTVNTVISDIDSSKKSQIKVRALYDFEAAEENELTFKAGEIIINVDTSNEHWWTGSNHRGEGMFPAQFVTMDLDVQFDKPMERANQLNTKKDTNFTQQPDLYPVRPSTPAIEESRIDDCIRLIEDADPTGEMRPDPAELAKCEAQCRQMGPLIDQELEKVDRHYNRLAEINRKIIESFQMYNELMTQSGMTRPTSYMWPSHPQQGQFMSLDPTQMHSQQMYNVQQQPQSIEQMRFQPMHYYGGVENTTSQHEIRNNALSMNLNQSLPLTGYPLLPHMSQDKDRSQFPPPSSSNNNALSEHNPNMNIITYPMHNNFTPSNYHQYPMNEEVEPNVSFVQK